MRRQETNSKNSAESGGSQKSRSVSAGLFTALERIVSQVCQLAIFITAARLLTPSEFGFFALISAFAILLLRFAEVGWAQYIMSWSGSAKIPAQVLFIAILSGLVLSSIGMASAQVLALLGFSAETRLLVTLFSLWVALATASSAQKGVMIWQHKLRSSAMSEILGELFGLAVAIGALVSGLGIMALVLGRIAMQTVHLVISFMVTRLAPRRGMALDQRQDLFAYSVQIFSSRMIINLRLYSATFIIGGFLGTAAVGYYRAAERLTGAVAEVVGVPAHVLAWSLFRQARDQHDGALTGFQEQANVFFHIAILTAIPVFAWVGFLASDLIVGLLGPKWLPAVPVVVVLATARAVMVAGVASEPILSLAGEIRRLPKFALLFLIVNVGVTLAAGPFGMLAIAWSQVAVSVFIAAMMLQLMHRYGAISWREVATHSYHGIIPLILAVATLVFVRDSAIVENLAPLVRVLACSAPALAVYLVALIALDPLIRRYALAQTSRFRSPPLGGPQE